MFNVQKIKNDNCTYFHVQEGNPRSTLPRTNNEIREVVALINDEFALKMALSETLNSLLVFGGNKKEMGVDKFTFREPIL